MSSCVNFVGALTCYSHFHWKAKENYSLVHIPLGRDSSAIPFRGLVTRPVC